MTVMNDHERILRLRPANVVDRLGQGSTLPILEPRRLGRALLERGVPLLCVPVLLPPVMAGLLRAARELDAVIGLSCPALYERPVAAEAFITALKNEGEGLHRKPFFLQAGPLRLSSSSPAALEQAYAVACKLLDAGFSLLSLDGSRLGVANSVQACRDLVQATMGKGVAVELTAPRNAGGRTSAEGLRNYLQSLEKAGARPDFVRVGVPLLEEEQRGEQRHDGLDTALLGELAAVASRFGVELTVADRGRTAHSEFIEWARVGARKLDAGDTFSRIVLDALPEDVSKGLLAHAVETQIPVADLLGASESILQSLDARTQERLEALSFADALALLGALRAANSATESMSWLVENGLHAH
jgi:hypothetical protein